MTTPEEFAVKLKKGLGKPNPFNASVLKHLLKPKEIREATIRYDWIKDDRFWVWVAAQPNLDFDDGEEWIRIFMYTDEQMKEFEHG